jgi:hypothetical protein
LRPTLEEVVQTTDVVLIGTKVVDRQLLQSLLRTDQAVIDLVNLDSSQRPQGSFAYEGICW